MNLFAKILAVALCAIAGIVLFLSLIALYVFSIGYAIYKIPFIIRERREIINGH